MVFSINPDNLENNDFRLVDDDGDLELLHKPSGATFTYDAGEDAWIPSAGFGTEANPVSGTSHFDAVTTEVLEREDTVIDEGAIYLSNGFFALNDPDDVSTSTFTTIAELGGAMGWEEIRDGVTLEGNFSVRVDDIPSDETGTYLPRVLERDPLASVSLTELELEVSGDDDRVDTGWTEITSINTHRDVNIIGRDIQAKITDGTLNSRERFEFGLGFRVVVD